MQLANSGYVWPTSVKNKHRKIPLRGLSSCSVHIPVYLCAITCVYMVTHRHTFRHTGTHIHRHAGTHIHTGTQAHTYTATPTHTHTYTGTHSHADIYRHTDTHIHIDRHKPQTHTYTHAPDTIAVLQAYGQPGCDIFAHRPPCAFPA
jgi:hypothetical protein